MLTAAIPPWDSRGIIPSVLSPDPTGSARSPYGVSLFDLISRFGTSPERVTILEGLLAYRLALHAIGLTNGFQWIDGSFTENVEQIRLRSPDDIDVTTFFHLPPAATQLSIFQADPSLFQPDKQILKDRFHVDASYTSLQSEPEKLVERSIYWYGVWSHQRVTLAWKGYLQITLDPVDDSQAAALIKTLPTRRTQQ